MLATVIASTAMATPSKGAAEVKVDGKPIDLKKLTTEEVIQLSNLILKAAGKAK